MLKITETQSSVNDSVLGTKDSNIDEIGDDSKISKVKSLANS